MCLMKNRGDTAEVQRDGKQYLYRIPTLPEPIPAFPKRPDEASHRGESQRPEESASAPPSKKARAIVATTGRSVPPRRSRPPGGEGGDRSTRSRFLFLNSFSPLLWLFPGLAYHVHPPLPESEREGESVVVVSQLTKPALSAEKRRRRYSMHITCLGSGHSGPPPPPGRLSCAECPAEAGRCRALRNSSGYDVARVGEPGHIWEGGRGWRVQSQTEVASTGEMTRGSSDHPQRLFSNTPFNTFPRFSSPRSPFPINTVLLQHALLPGLPVALTSPGIEQEKGMCRSLSFTLVNGKNKTLTGIASMTNVSSKNPTAEVLSPTRVV